MDIVLPISSFISTEILFLHFSMLDVLVCYCLVLETRKVYIYILHS